MKQDQTENFEEFVFRLKDPANRCQFTDADDMIVDQVIEGCCSSDLRKINIDRREKFDRCAANREDIRRSATANLTIHTTIFLRGELREPHSSQRDKQSTNDEKKLSQNLPENAITATGLGILQKTFIVALQEMLFATNVVQWVILKCVVGRGNMTIRRDLTDKKKKSTQLWKTQETINQ